MSGKNIWDSGYMGVRAKLTKMQPTYERILQTLPEEQQAFLEKYLAVTNEFWEEYGKSAYATGYNHGLHAAERQKEKK